MENFLKNNEIVIDDGVFFFDDQVLQDTDNSAWKNDLQFFKKVKINAMAIMKMLNHAVKGGTLEIMGNLIGTIRHDTFIVSDIVSLPVVGSETRVNAGNDALVYNTKFNDLAKQAGQLFGGVGWYHSHPGYGPYLSGIDVGTQRAQQGFNDPYIAIVIDPIKTCMTGKVDVGAFRTYPEGKAPKQTKSSNLQDGIPEDKIKDFGAWHTEYYALEISYFVSSVDLPIIESCCNRFWIGSLKDDQMANNKKYLTDKLHDVANKSKGIARVLSGPGTDCSSTQLKSLLKFSGELSQSIHQECVRATSFK